MGWIIHRDGFRRGLLAIGAAVLTASALVTTALPAAAESKELNGQETRPGQPYKGHPDKERDWIGSYRVDGKQVFCVSFALKAPDTDEPYEPGDELLTKWGNPIPADTAANISYLLLRYGDTESDDEAAALAHLLHTWTAGDQLEDAKVGAEVPFKQVAYNVDFHLGKLKQGTLDAIDRMKAEAEANRGPWKVTLTPPESEQVIGTAANWTITIKAASGKGVPEVPVNLKLTDAEVDGKDSVTVRTGEDGTATLSVTPTGKNPKVVANLKAPADRPYVREPVDANTQRVVSTGGEAELDTEASTTAKPKPPETTTETTTVTVPRTIPAGAQPQAMGHAETTSGPSAGAVAGLGALALLASGLIGLLARRRYSKR